MKSLSVLVCALSLLVSISCCYGGREKLSESFYPQGEGGAIDRSRELRSSIISNPVGMMFKAFRKSFQQQMDEQTVPNFLFQSIESEKNERIEENNALYQNSLDDPDRDSMEVEKEEFQDRRPPESEIESPPILYINEDELDEFYSKSVREYVTPLTHVPIDSPSNECSERGTAVGETKNICERRDCMVTILRCPPNLDVPIDPLKYASMNISDCHVEEIVCMDQVIPFERWEYTKIHELLCHGVPTPVSEGDLDHCSILTMNEGPTLYNFTLAPEDDDKCYVDSLMCPRYCNKVEMKCEGKKYKCAETLKCVDGIMQCKGVDVVCANETITCNHQGLECMDRFPTCKGFTVECDDGTNPCETYDGNEAFIHQATCNRDGLVECLNTLAICDDHVIACGDTERIVCIDTPKPLISYPPAVTCHDNLEECEDFVVLCDNVQIYCPDGYQWHFNVSLDPAPICIQEELDLYEYLAVNEDEEEEENEDLYLDDDEEVTYPIILSKELCRLGNVNFECSVYTCVEREFSCESEERVCDYDDTVITGEYPHYQSFCEGIEMRCYSDPECTTVKSRCSGNEKCYSIFYVCSELEPNNCAYHAYYCMDGCWARDGEWECICPLDFMGEQCQDFRPYTCEVNLLAPEKDCKSYSDPKESKLELDAVCLEYSVYDNVQFSYSIDCKFTDRTGIEKSINHTEVTFDYYTEKDDVFAISSFVSPPRMRLKIFNFDELSDKSAAFLHTLTPEELSTGQSFYFKVDFAPLYDYEVNRRKYFTGGRIYMETDLYNSHYSAKPPGMDYRQTDRQFIDFNDFVYAPEEKFDSFWYFVYIQFADPTLVIALVVCFSSIYYFVKKHQAYTIAQELSDKTGKRFKNE